MATKITSTIWNDLIENKTPHISEGDGSVMLKFEQHTQQFVMSKYVGGNRQIDVVNRLDIDHNSLNTVWQKFAGK